MRIGLISDSHVSKPGELWPQVFDAFDGVDAILHAGDLWSLALIDELAEIAPVHVARGNGDMGLAHARLRERCVLDFNGATVAMLHEFPAPGRRPADFILGRARQRFPDASPDVIVYGHTHIEEVHQVGELLCVNPGSPTLPHNKSLRLGTIGFLNIDAAGASAELYQLTASGIEPVQPPDSPAASGQGGAGQGAGGNFQGGGLQGGSLQGGG